MVFAFELIHLCEDTLVQNENDHEMMFLLILFQFVLLLFVFGDMPYPEDPLDLVPVYHREKNDDERNTCEREEPFVLVMPQQVATECQQDGSEQPACPADHEELCCGEVSEPEEVAQVILWERGDKEEEKDEEGSFVVEEVVESLHRFLIHKPFNERSPKCPGECEGNIGACSKSYGGKDHTEQRPVEESPKKAGYFTRDGRSNDLCGLEENKAYKREGTEGIQEIEESLLVEEEMDQTAFIDNHRDADYNEQ
jgi:hypothetical protein